MTVTDIVHLLTSYSFDVLKCRRKVVFSHLVEGKIPKVKRGWTQVFVAISVASAVTNPHIVALISEYESWSQMLLVDDPGVRAVCQTMLQVDDFFTFSYLGVFS